MRIPTVGDALPSPNSSVQADSARFPRQSTAITVTPTREEEPQHRSTVKGAITTANRAMLAANAQVQFAIDNESGRTLIKVVDTESKRVIRQIPTEEILVIARNIDKLQGLIVRGVA
jgi:flagellar protein FlaG